MADTDIEWTRRPGTRGKTWNPLGGCSDAGKDCAECYAKGMAWRIPNMARARGQTKLVEQYTGLTKKSASGRVQWTGVVRPFPERLAEPLSWKSPCTIFINSMSDLFHEDVPFEFIASVYGVMAATPHHTYLGLTKRADRKREFFEWVARNAADLPGLIGESVPDGGAAETAACVMEATQILLPNETVPELERQRRARRYNQACSRTPWPLPNVWEGTSCGVRDGLSRIDELRKTPAALRFLSLEPLLEDLGELDLTGIHWVIVGGESGHRARVCHVDWIRSIVAQCKAAGVPCFVKQLGANIRVPDHEPLGDVASGWTPYARECVSDDSLIRLSDRKGGDMAEWSHNLRLRQFPEVA